MMADQRAPRRKIVGRSFAHAGTRIMLKCGHSLISYNGRPTWKSARCDDCRMVANNPPR